MIQDLQALIEGYLNSSKSRTLHTLANKAGISYSTIRRVAQGEVRAVDLANVLAILGVVTDWNTALNLVSKHFPEAAKFFTSVSESKQITENISEPMAASLLDYERFVIVSLAATPLGTTEAQVVSVLGNHAAVTFDEMLSDGLLVSRDGRMFTAQLNFASTDLHSQATQVAHCLRFLRKEHMGRRRQHVSLHTDGVDAVGQARIHAVLEKALIEADAIAAEHSGELVVFYGVHMGLLSAGGGKHA